jgi:TatD DNase family protein
MLVDSHCHLDFPEFAGQLDSVLELMRQNDVGRALCAGVTLPDFPRVRALAERYPHIYAAVGVHPDHEQDGEVSVERLLELADHPKVVAIGETGLDYYRLTGDLEWQRERFRIHIRAARNCNKPLIIHTRSAAADTLRVMREEGAEQVRGVMHCFTESWEVAQAAMEMGFFISFSGIVTFKNARAVQEVAEKVPLTHMLIETDAPYLAPVPHRGKLNQPGYVRHVAEAIAAIKNVTSVEVSERTTDNFNRLFMTMEVNSNEDY